MLELSFKKVYIANNGEDGLKEFIKNQSDIDVVVTDIRMPVLNGTEMIQEIRKLRPYMPILVTTAFSDRDYLMKSIELGVNSYMVKPFKMMELLEKIKLAYYPVIQDKKFHDQYNLTKNILDAQNNFTLLVSGKDEKVKLANQTMLDFFGFNSLEEFFTRYNCICDLFLHQEGYLQKENNGKTWFDVVINNKDKIHKIKLLNKKNDESIFYITAKEIIFQRKKHYVMIFTDITELEILTEKKILQQKQLAEHAKMAQMGSMIGSIAHQWRQPLSIISSVASAVQVRNSIDDLTPDQINEFMERLIETTEYLSTTITTFRNFLKEKKEYKEVCIQDRIDIALNIVTLTLKENSIELIKDLHYDEPIMVKIVTGELVEVIINIMNNAKDAICDKDKRLKEEWVKITLDKVDTNAVITIQDSAGGIPAHILPKIFDEYFTTKDELKGTGLGLYMSKQIIEESLHGKLSVENCKNGAKFTIELPLVQNLEPIIV